MVERTEDMLSLVGHSVAEQGGKGPPFPWPRLYTHAALTVQAPVPLAQQVQVQAFTGSTETCSPGEPPFCDSSRARGRSRRWRFEVWELRGRVFSRRDTGPWNALPPVAQQSPVCLPSGHCADPSVYWSMFPSGRLMAAPLTHEPEPG